MRAIHLHLLVGALAGTVGALDPVGGACWLICSRGDRRFMSGGPVLQRMVIERLSNGWTANAIEDRMAQVLLRLVHRLFGSQKVRYLAVVIWCFQWCLTMRLL